MKQLLNKGSLGTEATSRGLALMEILVVAGIILILMTVALPGLQEAHLRSSYVQVKEDIHSLVVAQEEYYLDFGVYPTESENDPEERPVFERGLFWLTSPIPYIAEIPVDPFLSQNPGHERDRYETGGIEIGGIACSSCLATWVILSPGPRIIESELRSADPHYSSQPSNPIESYNPTNGTLSRGPIFQYGGDPFWIGVRLTRADKRAYYASGDTADSVLAIDSHTYLHRLPPPLK